MTPRLSTFIDSLDRFVENAADGRLTHGQRIKLWFNFEEEFGPSATERRDLLGALVARKIFKQLDPHWLQDAAFDEDDGDYRRLMDRFLTHFGSNLSATLEPNSLARAQLLNWCDDFEVRSDFIYPLLKPRDGAVVLFCAVLAKRYRCLEERLLAEICHENEWSCMDDVDPQYRIESDCGPITIEDGWERICEHDMYAPQEELTPDRRAAWHFWVNQVRMVCDYPDKARSLI